MSVSKTQDTMAMTNMQITNYAQETRSGNEIRKPCSMKLSDDEGYINGTL